MSLIYPLQSNPDLFIASYGNEQKYNFEKRNSLIDTTKEEEQFYQKIISRDTETIKRYIQILTPKTFRDNFKLLFNEKKANRIILAQEALEEKITIEKLTTIEDKLL